MTTSNITSHDFVVVYYIGNRKTGTLHIVTAPGGGTRIAIRLPLANIAAPEAVPEEHAA